MHREEEGGEISKRDDKYEVEVEEEAAVVVVVVEVGVVDDDASAKS